MKTTIVLTEEFVSGDQDTMQAVIQAAVNLWLTGELSK